VPTTAFTADGHLLQFADGVLEHFAAHVAGSVRMPAVWTCANLEQRKGDLVRVEIGTTTDPAAPFYSSPMFRSAAFVFDLPAADEPRLRAFLDEVARESGRA
jgi:hypothetical protein